MEHEYQKQQYLKYLMMLYLGMKEIQEKECEPIRTKLCRHIL